MNSELIDIVLGAAKKVRRFEQGESIFREGEPSQGVYLVQDGTVDLTSSARHGDTKRMRVAGHGEILGLSAVTTHRTHECSATASSKCEIGFIDRIDFLRALEETPAVWFTVLHFLSREVNAAYEEMRGLAGRQRERSPA